MKARESAQPLFFSNFDLYNCMLTVRIDKYARALDNFTEINEIYTNTSRPATGCVSWLGIVQLFFPA
jgi:hypothetical protein